MRHSDTIFTVQIKKMRRAFNSCLLRSLIVVTEAIVYGEYIVVHQLINYSSFENVVFGSGLCNLNKKIALIHKHMEDEFTLCLCYFVRRN